jgi:hypothetical protein
MIGRIPETYDVRKVVDYVEEYLESKSNSLLASAS